MENKSYKNNQEDFSVNVQLAWKKLNDRIVKAEHEEIKKLRFEGFPVFYRVAAMILVVLGIALSTFITIYRGADYTSVSTTGNEISHHIMPDGSVIELNSASKIKYKTGFEDNVRRVKLKGEAFFNVMPDKNMPFIVETKNAKVKVLGTAFNVLNRDENKTEVFVSEGVVSVTSGDKQVSLYPGDRAMLLAGDLIVFNNKDENYLAWKTKNIVFKNTPLVEVIKVLEHTYNTSIVFENELVKNYFYTATISEQPLNMVLEALDSSFEDFSVDKSKNGYVIQ